MAETRRVRDCDDVLHELALLIVRPRIREVALPVERWLLRELVEEIASLIQGESGLHAVNGRDDEPTTDRADSESGGSDDNGLMALSIDIGRALRTVTERQQLVEAIRDALLHEQETDSVEWKGSVDLTEKKWQAEIARQVIGFANRHPGRVASTWGGCAYLVLGAAPGAVSGITPVDSAKLDDTVSVYAGKDGPQWSPDYVQVDGTTVLVVTVEPPQWGDTIFAFRKTFEGYANGDVFTRRNGKTERANHQEIRMLTERAATRGDRLGVDLEWWESPCEASALDLSETAVERWITDERNALLASRLPSRRGPTRVLGDLAAEARNERERPEHEKKVERYLTEVRPRARDLWVSQAVEKGLGKLDLAVVNLTEHNFADVDVVMEFEGSVWSAFDRFDFDTMEFPPRPKPWMAIEKRGLSVFGDALRIPDLTVARFNPYAPDKSRGRSTNSGSTTLRFASVDVRPGYRHHIGPVYLIADAEYAGQEIDGSWHATSRSASGLARGVFTVRVRELRGAEPDL